MSREALFKRETFIFGAQSVEPVAPAPRFPGPRQMDLPFRVHAIYAGSMFFFLAAISSLAIQSPPMPVIFGICAFFFVMFFGVMNLMASIDTGEPKQRDTYHSNGIDTGSGHLSAVQASAQVLTLPLLMAGFGVFAVIAGHVVF